VLGATGTGLVALAASAAVVACVVLGPDPDRFLVRPSLIADDAP
jgi:hypothetical protein